MKKSTLILLILSGLFVVSLFGSSFILKNEYNRIDRSDPFWNYNKLARGNFHHIQLIGGNITRIMFVPGPHGFAGVLNYSENILKNRIQAKITNDTLFVNFQLHDDDQGRKNWMKYHVLLAISCPELLSVEAVNSNLEVYKLKQPDVFVSMTGKSSMEIESLIHNFDSLSILQRDSSELKFEMAEDIPGSAVMHAKTIYADVKGNSLLDIGHFQTERLHHFIGDSAAVILSGSALHLFKEGY
ncbi:MAG TPA: hypothetical protein VGH64_16665 [Puia sp.]|jgi:hypothetical protein